MKHISNRFHGPILVLDSFSIKRRIGVMSAPRLTTPPNGRGALSNATNRYERLQRVADDPAFSDGWTADDDEAPKLGTSVTIDKTKTIIARNQSPDVPFDRSINPFRGCEHGCIYCFARPTHAYLGLSPGLDFETQLLAKPEAAKLLDRELRKPGYVCRPIALGTNTDPYQPIERTWQITRAVLKTLIAFRHPFTIVTKSAMVARDLDLLAPAAAQGLTRVAISVTTLDRRLARRMEPRAATPEKRLATIKALAEAGVPTGVMVAPIVPALTDSETEAILRAAAAAGARSAGYVLLRLPLEIKELFREWLAANAPLRAERVIALIRALHGGRDYDSTFRKRQVGEGPYAQMIAERFKLARRRLGLDRDLPALDTRQFAPPARPEPQMNLL
jgi:DNA repair photolyase